MQTDGEIYLLLSLCVSACVCVCVCAYLSIYLYIDIYRYKYKNWIHTSWSEQYVMPIGTLHIWNTVVNRKALLAVSHD